MNTGTKVGIVLLLTTVSWHPPVAQEVELIRGYFIEPQALTFVAASNGCTTAESFRVDVEHFVFTLIRVQPDTCEAHQPYGVPVTFSPSDMGLGGSRLGPKQAQ